MALLQVLSEKRYDLEGFVQYAHSLRESQSFHTSKAANMQRVADIHNTLRKYSISISPEARETLQRLQGVWGDFEVALLDGEEFVKKQTPIKAQGLQDSILVCFNTSLHTGHSMANLPRVLRSSWNSGWSQSVGESSQTPQLPLSRCC